MSIDVTELARFDLFDVIADDPVALADFAAAVDVRTVAAGTRIAEQGAAAVGLVLLCTGTATTSVVSDGHAERVGRQVAPTWIGAISALSGEQLGVVIEADVELTYGIIESATFRQLTFRHEAVHRRVMQQVAPVVTRLTAVEQNRERLASLGTMAAGLAHELNNPSAAAQRAAADLRETLDAVTHTLEKFVSAGVEREHAARLLVLHREALERAKGATALSALDAADLEDEIADALERHDVAEPWRLAPSLAAAGVDVDWVDRVAAEAGDARGHALRWTASTLAAHELTAELLSATRQLSDLVGAVKTYAYMDRGELVSVDVHEGLEATLTVLKHKLKHTGIELVRDYDRTVPKAAVYGSELNQVWTNLIDNAIQAMGDAGTLTIRTRDDGPCVLVEITDTGPGIPPEIRGRIYDAFFTTKGAGAGTGLGLATARRIVVERHGGSLELDSDPGRTTFHVWIPYQRR